MTGLRGISTFPAHTGVEFVDYLLPWEVGGVSGGRGVLAILASAVVVASTLAVPPLAEEASAVRPAVDDDVSVAGNGVSAATEEPSAAEDATVVTSPLAADPAWPGAGTAVVDVPVAAGRSTAAEVAPSPAVAGVSVLADGAAAEALPRTSLEPSRTGPGPLPSGTPSEVGGLAAGGLSRLRVIGQSRAVADVLGAAQVFTLERVDGAETPAAADVRVDYSEIGRAHV